jgi:predicted nucleic acid-binding protein
MVEAWLNRQISQTLYITATSLSELRLGVALLPAGRRKQQMAQALDEAVELLVASRILPFDQRAADVYALLVSRARAAGYTVSVPDGQIAAIAQVHGFTVATRDTGPYIAAGVPVIDPWNE